MIKWFVMHNDDEETSRKVFKTKEEAIADICRRSGYQLYKEVTP